MKQCVKGVLNGFFVVLNLPFLALYVLLKPISRRDELFAGFSQFYALWPGKMGVYFRRNFYRFTMKHFGKNVTIGFGTLFSHVDTEIGDNVYIGPQSNIGMCRIGSECLIGSGVHVLSGRHQHNFSDKNRPLREQGGVYIKIKIDENCWIGNCAVVMGNVAARTVVGAGAIIVTVTQSDSIVLGPRARQHVVPE